MTRDRWVEVDRYVEETLIGSDPALAAALRASDEAGLPHHTVSSPQGKFLALMAQAVGARSILEVGTLGGFSAIWLARTLPPGGKLVTLELDPRHAEVARSNLERAGLLDRVEIRVGAAADTLASLVAAGEGPFDLVFIDADKPNNPVYFERALELSRPGTVLIIDNVVRDGAVVEADSADPRVQGVRQLFRMLEEEPRVSATALQTVGSKGYDGFAMALVLDEPTQTE